MTTATLTTCASTTIEPETEAQMLARLLAPEPYLMPRPATTPRINAREARRARTVFVKDGGGRKASVE